MSMHAPVAKGQPPPGMAKLDHWSKRPVIAFLATGLGSGFIRPYSGTWGSIPAVFLAWGLQRLGNDWLFVASTVAMVAASIWVASQAEGLFGHDSGRIVIDEFAGVFICYLGLPADAWVMIPVFVFFRVFDVMKFWPCRNLERLGGGLGVTADDIGAGVYTNIAVRIVILLVARVS
jgi:phosphatidylglycerophosphatase A